MPKAFLTKEEFDALSENSDLRKEFTQLEDGRYKLRVEGVDGFVLENVEGLKRTISKEQANNKKLTEQFKGITPEWLTAARENETKIAEMKDWTPDNEVQKRIDAQVAGVETKFNKDRDTWTAEKNKLNDKLHTTVLLGGLDRAIASKGANPHLIKGALKDACMLYEDPITKTLIPVAKDPTQDGIPLLTKKEGSTAPMPPEELLDTWKTDERYMGAFAGLNNKGLNTGDNKVDTTTAGGKPVIDGADPAALGDNIEAIRAGEVLVDTSRLESTE